MNEINSFLPSEEKEAKAIADALFKNVSQDQFNFWLDSQIEKTNQLITSKKVIIEKPIQPKTCSTKSSSFSFLSFLLSICKMNKNNPTFKS